MEMSWDVRKKVSQSSKGTDHERHEQVDSW